MTVYMARQRKSTVSKTTRLITGVNDALQQYASDQLISENAAINQLLKEILTAKGYTVNLNEDSSDV
jgi:hypothetical protein